MTETASADTANEAERGRRGASFPTMDLASAADTIHTVGKHGAEFSASAFAQYLGHQTANSGPFRTKVAAFRDWGLVTAKDGRVALTNLGKDVARSGDPKADVALLRRAFDSCKIFKDFFDNQAKGIPIKRDVLGRAATLDFKVSPTSQDKFVSTLVDSAAAVGLATSDAETVTFTGGTPAHEEAEPTRRDPEPEDKGGNGGGDNTRRTPHVDDSAAPLVLRQVWPTATGEVVLMVHSTEPLPASAFALVGTAVQAASDLADSIGKPAEPAEHAS